MPMHKTQYAWMSLGGLICLFALVLACKLRDGNQANAQPEIPEPTPIKKELPPSIFTLPPTLPTKEPELLPAPKKTEKTTDRRDAGPTPKDQAQKEQPSAPKATLEMPMPSEFSQISPVMGASFSPNTPTPPEPKDAKKPAPLPPPLPSPSSSKSSEKKSETPLTNWNPGPKPLTNWNAPATVTPTSNVPAADHESAKTQPGEPPLAPAPGPVQLYHVRGMETLHDIARRTLGSSERWIDLHKLNPTLKPDEPLHSGTTVRLPADACVQNDDSEPVKPLPILRCKPPAPKAKVLPLTGTSQCSLDEKGQLTLPRTIRDQLNGSAPVLLSPGPDKCLWLTDQPHLERLGERLDQSHASEADVRVFKRLYFAQTEKLTVTSDGRVTIPERLGQFAGLHQEVVLVGIDDHFEVWDAARWRSYTQQKSAGPSATMAEQE